MRDWSLSAATNKKNYISPSPRPSKSGIGLSDSTFTAKTNRKAGGITYACLQENSTE
jgi:hypothetical protein